MGTETEDNLCLAEAWLSTELMYDQHVALHLQMPSSHESHFTLDAGKSFRDDLETVSCGSMISGSHATTAPASDLMLVNNVMSPPNLLDCGMRAMCKKVTLNEKMMHQAIERLGGGDKGLTLLMDYVRFWVGERSVSTSDRFSISDSLEQLCVTPSASSSTTQTTDYSYSPHSENGRSYCTSTSSIGDIETPQASFCAAQPEPLQAPELNWQQQQRLQEDELAQLDLNNQKRKRSVACTTMGFRMDDPSVDLGGAQYFRASHDQVWACTEPPLPYGKRSGNNYSTPTAAATRAARKHRMACQRQQLSKNYGVANAASHSSCSDLLLHK